MKFVIALNFLLLNAANGQSSSWTQVGGLVSNPGYSSAVSKRTYNDNAIIAFGDPTTNSVSTAWLVSSDNYIAGTIQGEQPDSEFGYDVQVSQDGSFSGTVVIGAPSFLSNGSELLGSFSVYRMNNDGTIEKRGETVVGGYDTPGFPGFGTAVTFLDNAGELVACNPNDDTLGSGSTEPHGRCFLYYNDLDNGWIKSPWISGTALNDYIGDVGSQYGFDVAGDCCINNNEFSSRYFVAGAPNGAAGRGEARVMGLKSDTNVYERYMSIVGLSDGDRCGTSVSASGRYVAVGCPGAGDDNNGMIRVFELETQAEVGFGTNTIMGEAGDKLGELNTMDIVHDYQTTGNIIQSLKVIVSTAQGVIKHYSFFDDEWIENENPYVASGGGPIRVSGGGIAYENKDGDVLYAEAYVAVSATNYADGPSSIQLHNFLTESPTTSPTQSPTTPEATPNPTGVTTPEPSAAPTMESSSSASGAATIVASVMAASLIWIIM